jgi:hypothetical protein
LAIVAPVFGQTSLSLLTQLAAEQVAEDRTFLGKTRFRISQQDRTVFYDFSALPAEAVLSNNDRYTLPLEALIRAEALRRDFLAAVPRESFWVAPLESIRQAVGQCVRDVERAQATALAVKNACAVDIERRFDALKASLLLFAAAQNFETAQGRGPTIGYRVQVKVEPPKARVRVMTLLEYKKSLYFKTPMDDHWIDLLAGEHDMIGRYRYRAEWPPELNGPEEGNFEVTEPTTITFRPKQK